MGPLAPWSLYSPPAFGGINCTAMASTGEKSLGLCLPCNKSAHFTFYLHVIAGRVELRPDPPCRGEHKGWERWCQAGDPSIAAGPHPGRRAAQAGGRRQGLRTAPQRRDCLARSCTNASCTLQLMKLAGQGQDEERGHPWPSAPKATGPGRERSQTRPQRLPTSSAKFIPAQECPSRNSKQEPLISGDTSHHPPRITGAQQGGGHLPRALLPDSRGRGLRTVDPSYFLTRKQSSDSSPERQGQ